MKLSDQEFEVIEKIWQEISSHGDELGIIHYTHVFENHKDIRQLFKAPVDIQAKRLIYGLNKIITNYRSHPDEVMNYIKLLGKQHRGFKAKRSHYSIIASSMSNAGIKLINDDNTQKRDLWTKFINEISTIMNASM